LTSVMEGGGRTNDMSGRERENTVDASERERGNTVNMHERERRDHQCE